MAESKDIRYVNKEFSDFRSQLVEFAKSYFPDTYSDFSAASPGMMFIEMASYVGDILAFYQDTQLQETFLEHARNPNNLYSLAYMMGYRPKVCSAAEVALEVSQIVNAKTVSGNFEPNWEQALKIPAGVVVKATTSGNTAFTVPVPIDFSFSSSISPTTIQVEEFTQDGDPATYLLTKTVQAYSGELKTTQRSFGSPEKFKTVTIEDTNIIRIQSITGTPNNEPWHEVPFLGQDTVMQDSINLEDTSKLSPYLLSLEKVPRRFVTRFIKEGTLQIQFGAGVVGTVDSNDSLILPDPTNITPLDKLSTGYDPSNFLFTKTYGLAPSNTTLTINYLVGTGVAANVPSNTLNTIGTIGTVTDGTGSTPAQLPSLNFNNPYPAIGGSTGDTLEELRQNSMKAFAEQQRMVTLGDYTIRALSLPPIYGAVAKVHVTRDGIPNQTTPLTEQNSLALSMYILTYDLNGKLSYANTSLKGNLKTYLSEYMMLTDAVDIKDAFIINIGVQYEILGSPKYSTREVLLSCNSALMDYLKTSNISINQPINISTLYSVLDKVKGVQVVKNVKIVGKTGGNYSEYGYDIEGATRGNVLYPSYDPCIFEVRYPEIDIEGRILTA